MNHFLKISFALSALAASCVVSAQNTRDAELASHDLELNQTYRSLMGRLDTEGQNALRTSQRLWIQFRDADCEVAYSDKRDCLIDRTISRNRQLRESYFWDRDGNYFQLGSKNSSY